MVSGPVEFFGGIIVACGAEGCRTASAMVPDGTDGVIGGRAGASIRGDGYLSVSFLFFFFFGSVVLG